MARAAADDIAAASTIERLGPNRSLRSPPGMLASIPLP